jgi:hypothetical protein
VLLRTFCLKNGLDIRKDLGDLKPLLFWLILLRYKPAFFKNTQINQYFLSASPALRLEKQPGLPGSS